MRLILTCVIVAATCCGLSSCSRKAPEAPPGPGDIRLTNGIIYRSAGILGISEGIVTIVHKGNDPGIIKFLVTKEAAAGLTSTRMAFVPINLVPSDVLSRRRERLDQEAAKFAAIASAWRPPVTWEDPPTSLAQERMPQVASEWVTQMLPDKKTRIMRPVNSAAQQRWSVGAGEGDSNPNVQLPDPETRKRLAAEWQARMNPPVPPAKPPDSQLPADARSGPTVSETQPPSQPNAATDAPRARSAPDNLVGVGMTEARLLELKGAPLSKATMGKKAIYRWPDMQVTLVDGQVDQIQKL